MLEIFIHNMLRFL